MTRATVTTYLGLLVTLLLTVLVYLPGMSAGFYFDDEPNILDVESVQWRDISLESITHTIKESRLTSRPVANLSFGINHALSGMDPAPFHWTNLFIHLLTGVALYWLVRLFQARHATWRTTRWMALLSVAIFLLHPLNIQAVTYVVQRMTSLATLFFLLSFACYITARYQSSGRERVVWGGLALLSALLSILSKEIGMLIIPMLILYELIFHKEKWKRTVSDVHQRIGTTAMGLVAILVFATPVIIGLYAYGDRFYWSEILPARDFSGYERVLTQSRVQFFYLTLLLLPLPSRLNIDHEFLISTSLFEPVTTLFAVVAMIALAGSAVVMRKNHPFLAFGILGYMILHSMESAPISLEMVFEHRMYLPIAMLMVMLGIAPERLVDRLSIYIVSVLILMGLGMATYERNLVWATPMSFYKDSAEKSPGKFRPNYNLGTEFAMAGDYDKAKESLLRALQIDPTHSSAHNQLANVYLINGKKELAEEHYRSAVKYNPANAEALYNLAMLLDRHLDKREKRQILREFIRYAPPYLYEQRQWAVRQLANRENPETK